MDGRLFLVFYRTGDKIKKWTSHSYFWPVLICPPPVIPLLFSGKSVDEYDSFELEEQTTESVNRSRIEKRRSAILNNLSRAKHERSLPQRHDTVQYSKIKIHQKLKVSAKIQLSVKKPGIPIKKLSEFRGFSKFDFLTKLSVFQKLKSPAIDLNFL